jgi:hypothetical protein
MMRGFTLIESIIYMALLAFIMTSVLTTVYLLMQGGASLEAKTATQDEGNFVMRKLDWVFGNMQDISAQPAYSNSLVFGQYGGSTVNVRLNAGKIEMYESNSLNPYTALTTDNVKVTYLGFVKFAGPPGGIEASTTINGITFTTRKYLRQ